VTLLKIKAVLSQQGGFFFLLSKSAHDAVLADLEICPLTLPVTAG